MGRGYSDGGVRLSRGSGGLAMPLALHGQCHFEMTRNPGRPRWSGRPSATRRRISDAVSCFARPYHLPHAGADSGRQLCAFAAFGGGLESGGSIASSDTFGVLRNSEFVGQTTSNGRPGKFQARGRVSSTDGSAGEERHLLAPETLTRLATWSPGRRGSIGTPWRRNLLALVRPAGCP